MTEYCTVCKPDEPKPHEGPGEPVPMPGMVHRIDCPTLKGLMELSEDLKEQLRLIRQAERRAHQEAHNYFIG